MENCIKVISLKKYYFYWNFKLMIFYNDEDFNLIGNRIIMIGLF